MINKRIFNFTLLSINNQCNFCNHVEKMDLDVNEPSYGTIINTNADD